MQLIIINGPCGVGKSTVAKALHNALPLSFLLDIDGQRRYVSHYREHEVESRALAMAVARAILETCLKEGRDVVLERMLFYDDTLDAFREIGMRYGAEIHELILWASKETVMQRAAARGYKEDSLLTPEKCERFWEEMDQLRQRRGIATVIDVDNLDEQQALEKVQQTIGL